MDANSTEAALFSLINDWKALMSPHSRAARSLGHRDTNAADICWLHVATC